METLKVICPAKRCLNDFNQAQEMSRKLRSPDRPNTGGPGTESWMDKLQIRRAFCF